MKRTTLGIARSAQILVAEQLREPISIFWSIVAPIGFMAFSTYQGRHAVLDPANFAEKAGWCLAYIALTVSFFGFGLYLIGRRESGFVRSFLTSRRKRNRFMLAQFMASLILCVAYGSIFILVTAFFLTDISYIEVGRLVFSFLLVCIVFMVGSIFFAALPITFQSASSLMSISVTILLVAGLVASRSPSGGVELAHFNPFVSAAAFISGTLGSGKHFLILTGQTVMLLALGIYGVMKQRLNPEWSNR
jgi:ABC-2 type transport system permease protein